MKVFRGEEFAGVKNPTPGKTYKKDILKEVHAQGLHGVFGLVIPGSQGGDYHYHERGEHIIVIVSGEGMEIVEGGEIPVKAGDVLYLCLHQIHLLS